MTMPRQALALVALASLALGACVGDANPVRDTVNAAGLGPKAVAAPDFVAGSRPGSLDYLPVGVSAPPREARPKSAESVRALEADLEAARGRNEARGGLARRAPPAKADAKGPAKADTKGDATKAPPPR